MVLNFAQIAVRFESVQKLKLVKKSGELIRETEERAMEDIWVFERVRSCVVCSLAMFRFLFFSFLFFPGDKQT